MTDRLRILRDLLHATPGVLEELPLPDLVRELAALIDIDGALAIIEHWGGGELAVPPPDKLGEDHPIVSRLGAERAALLAAHYCGERLDVPVCAAALRYARRLDIQRMDAAGATNREIARHHNLTTRAVRMIKSQQRR